MRALSRGLAGRRAIASGGSSKSKRSTRIYSHPPVTALCRSSLRGGAAEQSRSNQFSRIALAMMAAEALAKWWDASD
jgi:hypothetical protein